MDKVKYYRCDFESMEKIYKDGSVFGKQYDYIFLFGIYYHTLHPLRLFKTCYDMMKTGGILYFEGEVIPDSNLISQNPVSFFYLGEYQKDLTNWFVPSKKCLNDWLCSVGFIEVNFTEPSVFNVRDRNVIAYENRVWGNGKKD